MADTLHPSTVASLRRLVNSRLALRTELVLAAAAAAVVVGTVNNQQALLPLPGVVLQPRAVVHSAVPQAAHIVAARVLVVTLGEQGQRPLDQQAGQQQGVEQMGLAESEFAAVAVVLGIVVVGAWP